MEEVENVLRILRDAKKFVEGDNAAELKGLSNQTIHAAAISQDADNIVVAVLVYSLGKVLEREHYRSMEGWDDFHGAVVKNLGSVIKAFEKRNVEGVRIYLGGLGIR